MNRYHLLIIAVAGLMLQGCQKVLQTMYGIKDPEFESKKSVEDFHERIGFNGIPYMGIKPEAWINKKLLRITDLFVFDNQGRYIPYRDSLKPNCNGPAEQFLAQLDSKRSYYYSTEYSLESFLENLEGPDCGKAELKNDGEVDFYVFMTCAKFAGSRIYLQNSSIWFDSLRHNHHINYRLTLVNQDPKDCWSDEKKAMVTRE